MNKEKLEEIIFINLGRASMCWSEIPKGVFDSTTAAELGREILKAAEEYIEDQEPGWSDPMIEHLNKEEENYKRSLFALKEMQDERELIKKILDDPRNADGFSDDDHRNPKYNFEGFTYILNAELTRILGVEVPSAQVERHWLMEDLKERDSVWNSIKKREAKKKK